MRFNVDAQHLDTFISDPNAAFDVEVNLDERSRGFKWSFSFYITFSADTDIGKAEDAVLLLDEPGLCLHAKSQSDLLNHFEKVFSNQSLYTTNSPFMVPTHQVDSIRTASIFDEKGTTVTNDPSVMLELYSRFRRPSVMTWLKASSLALTTSLLRE